MPDDYWHAYREYRRKQKLKAKGNPKMEVQIKKCRYCPANIVFVRVGSEIVPVDVSSPVYRVEWPSGKAKKIANDGPIRAYVSHWKTCTGAEQARADRDAKKASVNGPDGGGSTTNEKGGAP